MTPSTRIAAIGALLIAGGASTASAQYYDMANQLMQTIRPALSGSTRYKGFVDATYVKGLGSLNADLVGVSTTQGFTYSNWFFMGAGLGVDLLFSHTDDGWGQGWNNSDLHSSTTTGVMIPLYSDFRFTVGNQASAGFFLDVRLGCSFLIGSDYLRISQGYLTNQQYFYLRPTIGVRVPLDPQRPGKQAFDLGVTYQLLTANYWYNYGGNRALNMLGVNVAFEW